MDESILLSLSDYEIYRIFMVKSRDLLAEKLITKSDISKIRYGISIKFSLSKYFRYKDSENVGIFRVKPKANTINNEGKGHVDLNKFTEELEARQALMLNALLDYYATDSDPVKPDFGDFTNGEENEFS